jgi:hypothetical protein
MNATENSTTAEEQAKEFHARLGRLQRAVSTAQENFKSSEVTLLEAKRALSTASAKSLADSTGTSDPASPETKALSDAYTQLEHARLTLIGCEAALANHDATALLEPLREQREQYRQQQVDKYLEEVYQPARMLYLDALHVLQALSVALGIKPALDGEQTLASKALSDALLTVPTGGNWRSDKIAYEIFEEHKQIHLLVLALERHQAEREHLIQRQLNSSVPSGTFDANGKYRVHQALRIRGVDHAVGSIVSLADMQQDGVVLLAKLCDVDKIRLLSEEQVFAQK